MRLSQCSLLTAGLSALLFFAAGSEAMAQKSESQIQKEYGASVKKYLGYLTNSFATRYWSSEQFLSDLTDGVLKEIRYRKDKKRLDQSLIDEWKAAQANAPSKEDLKAKIKMWADKIDNARTLLNELNKQSTLSELEDLHAEYERAYAEEHELCKLQIIQLRDKLIKSGQADDNRHLLETQLEYAVKRFKNGDMLVATFEFSDILESFKDSYKEWDDVYYYQGEALFRLGDYENAEIAFSKVSDEFSSSPFTERALMKLIRISYLTGSRYKIEKYFEAYQAKATVKSSSDRYNQIVYLAGLTFFKNSDFTKALSVMETIPSSSNFYGQARYVIAHCHLNLDDYGTAYDIFNTIAKSSLKGESLIQQQQLIDLAKLKMAYIRFEQAFNGAKSRVVLPIAKSIPGSSEFADAAMLVTAWSFFKDNNIDSARMYVDTLVNRYASSDYIFEAKTLLGNIDVLDPRLNDQNREQKSVTSYNYVANSIEAKYLADRFIEERDSIYQAMRNLEDAMQTASIRQDSLQYVRYDAMYQILNYSLMHTGQDTRSRNFSKEVSALVAKIRLLEDRLKNSQDEMQRKQIKSEINEMTSSLEAVVGGNPGDLDSTAMTKLLDRLVTQLSDGASDTKDLFSDISLSRLISEIDSRNRLYAVLKEKIAREKQQVQEQVTEIDRLMGRAKELNKQGAWVKLKIERNRLSDFYYRLSEYEAWLTAQDNIENYADLDVWGDFAAYGRNNITFVINTTKTESITDIARAISQIDKILTQRKKNYENQIAQLEQEIKLKEKEIRDKELQEARASQRQFYEQKYFLLKTTEKPDDDPYDYKDLKPEVDSIPVDVVKKAKEAMADSAAADTAQSTVADTTKKSVKEAPSDSTKMKTDSSKTKSDSANVKEKSGGQGQRSDNYIPFGKRSVDRDWYGGSWLVRRFKYDSVIV